MKLRIVCVGKLETYLARGTEDYAGRIGRYLPFALEELKEEKGGKRADPRYIRDREGERILARLPSGATVVSLDEKGKALTSEGLARWLEKEMVGGTPELVFVIGGAYGLSRAVKERSDLTLSLSSMTFTHQMARLILVEQIYRGMTILRNEPYHNR